MATTQPSPAAVQRLTEYDTWLPAQIFRRAMVAKAAAAFTLILMAFTWRLWTPQHAFPQVPVCQGLLSLPDACQWACLTLLVASLLASLLLPARTRWADSATMLSALLLACLMAGDQHRWQPWAYHMLLTFVALARLGPEQSFKLLRWLSISIYVFSGWSKCDITFADTLGQQFWEVLLAPVHGSLAGCSTQVQRGLAGVFPLAEFAIAAALAWPRSRRVGLGMAIASHLLLIAILGPWGLNHRPAVLVWNVYFIVQDILLFSGTKKSVACLDIAPAIDSHRRSMWRHSPLAAGLIGLAILAPLLEPFGYCDHWPAWSLYAPRVERVRVLVPRSQTRRLSAELQAQLADVADEPDWVEVRLDRWSLAALDAPLYPQNRFQLAVAVDLAERYQWGNSLHVVCLGNANRWTGHRDRETLSGGKDIAVACQRYWLNTRARSF
jgi:hypothetical protein